MSSFVETPPGLTELAQNLVDIMEKMRVLHGSALTVIAAMEHADIARTAGYPSVAALISDLVRITPHRAARLATQAGLVTEAVTPTGHVTPARLPLVRDALSEGVLDPDHVDMIAATVKKIPVWAPGDTAQIVEKHLVDLARETHSSVLRSHGETLLARIDPDGAQPADEAEPTNMFRYRRDQNGRMYSPAPSIPKPPKSSTRCSAPSRNPTAQEMTGIRRSDWGTRSATWSTTPSIPLTYRCGAGRSRT